jgi:quercetin dioxygenase-like cupin family protein
MSDAGPTIGSYDGMDADEPYPGVHRRAFDAQAATVTRYDFDPSASFPLHRHPQEQVTVVDEGSVKMRIGNREWELIAGGWSVVPGGLEHGITAGPGGARITAIVIPRREQASTYEVVA